MPWVEKLNPTINLNFRLADPFPLYALLFNPPPTLPNRTFLSSLCYCQPHSR